MSVSDTVNEWFRQHIACGPIARDTPAYNQALTALPVLISALEPKVSTPPGVEQTAEPHVEGDAGAEHEPPAA